MDLLKLKKFSKKEPVPSTKLDKTIFNVRSRFFYSIIACSIPIFAFLLTSAYSESKKAEQDNKKQQRAAISNPFNSETIDNELSFSKSEEANFLAHSEKAEHSQEINDRSKGDSQNNSLRFDSNSNGEHNDSKSEIAAKSEDDKENINTEQGRDLDQLTTVLNVTDADIEALIKTFSKLTGRNYVVDSAVKGKITIHLPTAIKISEALQVFDSILLLKGFATVPIGANIWKVIVAKDAKQTTIPLSGAAGSSSESLVTEILKSTHVGSEEIQKLVAQFISKDGYSQAISGTNLLILVDAASNIERIKTLLKEIDIPPVDQDITIIPIKHSTASDLADKINSILSNDDKDKAADATQIASQLGLSFRRSAANLNASLNNQAEQQSGGTGASRSSPLKIIPDDRTNSLIVVADEFTTLKIRALAEQLDSEIDKSSGRFWVYRLEHANAEELSEVLGNLISGSGGGSSSSNQTGSSISRSNRDSSSDINSSASQFGLNGGSGSAGSRKKSSISRDKGSNAPSLISDSSKVAFEDEISVAADPSTNSLIVNASKADYEKLSQVISELDVKRRQVLVEATILEVSLNDEEALGVELQGTGATTEAGVLSQTNFGGLTQLLTDPKGLTDLTIAAASTGTLTLPGGLKIPSQAALISAVSKHTNVNVLSAPTILSTDNQEAEIIVGENVPFVTSTSTNQTNLNNTFNQIQRQDVGITLKITPQLGTGDFLTLQIFVEISNVVDGTRGDANGPTTTVRTTDTVVAVKNKQMIVTGGLIQDSANTASRGVPFLEDVPVVGMLFRKNSEVNRRTNLLIFLTPQIIQDQFDARDQSKLKAKNLSEVFEKTKTTPNREEVLKNPALDEVLESGKQLKIQNNVPLTSDEVIKNPIIRNVEKNIDTAEHNSDGVYEFTVLGQDKGTTPKIETTKDSLFVVFRSINGKPSNLETNSDGSIGIVVPKTPDNKGIFTTGGQYYLSDKNLICLGVYLNQQEAETMHADLLKWNLSQMESQKEFIEAGWSFSDDSRNN